MVLTQQRGGATRWQQSQRVSIPASMGQLVGALKRLCGEATRLADQAYTAIQKHSFEPYWTFRAKIDEHAALMAVIRGRLPHLREMRQPGVDAVVAAVDHAEQEDLPTPELEHVSDLERRGDVADGLAEPDPRLFFPQS